MKQRTLGHWNRFVLAPNHLRITDVYRLKNEITPKLLFRIHQKSTFSLLFSCLWKLLFFQCFCFVRSGNLQMKRSFWSWTCFPLLKNNGHEIRFCPRKFERKKRFSYFDPFCWLSLSKWNKTMDWYEYSFGKWKSCSFELILPFSFATRNLVEGWEGMPVFKK